MIFSRGGRSRNANRYAKADAAIAAFWEWWPGVRARAEAAVESGEWDDLHPRLAERVSAIHADLQWEVSKGKDARHAFVVSPGGHAELRAYAVRWRDAAPPADDAFEYHAARQADPGVLESTMGLNGATLDLGDLRFGFVVDPDRDQAHVTVYHPVFPGLPEELRAQISFLTLDWLLGEEGVERWIGTVEFGGAPPPDAQPAEQLRAAVDRLAAEEKEAVWALMSGEIDGRPVIATAQQPLVAVRFPTFDTHVAVTLGFRRTNDGGFPVDESLEALRVKEDELTDLLHADDAGTLLAHETSGGVRILHFYVDSSTDGAERIRGRLDDWAEGKTAVKDTYDPGLRNVRHLNP